MDLSTHQQFLSEFDPSAQLRVLKKLEDRYRYPVGFRVCETPLFMSDEFHGHLQQACDEIISQLQTSEFRSHAATAIPRGFEVAGEDSHPSFLQIDFGLCEDKHGNLIPQLVELQGFASVFCWQTALDRILHEEGLVPGGWSCYYHQTSNEYISSLRDLIVGDANPENVIVLEIEPDAQRTNIDFACTEAFLKIRTVCLTNLRRKGSKLHYIHEGRSVPVERIYNRVIFDDLERRGFCDLNILTEPADVSWIAHPNWFYRISKHTLPFLKSRYVPESTLVSKLNELPPDLDNYVLKPLYSFAGAGVKVALTPDDFNHLSHPDQMILQRKMKFAACIPTPDQSAKAEIRMMFLWKDEPRLVNALVRFSKGALSGVGANLNESWVGANVAYHRES